MNSMTKTRYSVASEKGKENLKIMAEAIAAMKRLEPTNPKSWEYQAALHGTDNPNLVKAAFANSCPHEEQAGADTSKFFLVWHRLYLHYFEEAIRAVSGRQDFTLPYWDITDKNQRTIPKPFLSPEKGGYEGLYDSTRAGGLNNGETLLPGSNRYDQVIQELTDLKNISYELFNHRIELEPHNSVHRDIGGNMGVIRTAALDPIFWVHHANIDRLWAQYSSIAVDSNWLEKLTSGVTFGFFKQNDEPISYSYKEAAEAVYTLDYNYDNGSNTLKPESSSNASMSRIQSQVLLEATDQSQSAEGIALRNLEGNSLTLQASQTRSTRKVAKQSQRTILGISAESCHNTEGYIDILIGDASRNYKTFDAITNYTFNELTDAENGSLLEKVYAGSICFFPHADEAKDEHIHPPSDQECEREDMYYFDITENLVNLGTNNLKQISLTFNIDPTQESHELLKDLSITSYNLYII